MSGVHKSEREEVPALTRFRELAKELGEEATRVAANVITKHYRFVIGVQMAEAADELAELADESFEHYPSSALAAYDRRRCYSQAIAKAKTLKRQANKARRLKIAKPEAFKPLAEAAEEFIIVTRGLKKGVKVKGVESAEDAIAWHRAEADAIEALITQDADDGDAEPDDALQSGDVAPC